MKLSAFPLLAVIVFFAGCASAPTSNLARIPADILARPTCQEDVVLDSRVPIGQDLAAAFEEYGRTSATVIASYDLDGSGKAVDPQVIYAKPKKLFNTIALRQLSDTRFSPGVVRKSCTYVRTFSIEPRGTMELPVGMEPKSDGGRGD